MTTATGRVPHTQRGLPNQPVPTAWRVGVLAATPLYSGWLCARDANGYAVPFTETTGLTSLGKSRDDVPAADASGDREGIFDAATFEYAMSSAAGDSFVDAEAPAVCYGVDNQTIGKLSTGRSIAGLYLGVSAETGKARVFVGPVAHAMALALLAAPSVGGGSAPSLRARAATTANLSATLVANVLTADANGALGAQDGVTLIVGDKLFVKDQAAGAARGLYVVTSLGSGSSKFVLTRAPEFDASAEAMAGTSIYVSEGTVNGNQTWELTTDDPITLGTTALTFTRRPSLAELASTASGKGASLVAIEDAAGNTSTTDVEAALAELYGFNKLKVQAFDLTLVAGTATKNTGITVTSSTRCVGIVPTVRGGTFPAGGFQSMTAGNVVGAAGVGAVTVTARKADGTLENGCTDTVSVMLIG